MHPDKRMPIDLERQMAEARRVRSEYLALLLRRVLAAASGRWKRAPRRPQPPARGSFARR